MGTPSIINEYIIKNLCTKSGACFYLPGNNDFVKPPHYKLVYDLSPSNAYCKVHGCSGCDTLCHVDILYHLEIVTNAVEDCNILMNQLDSSDHLTSAVIQTSSQLKGI